MNLANFIPTSPDIRILATEIAGLLIFEKKIYLDGRGWFQEAYRVEDIAKALDVNDLVIRQGSFTYNLPGTLRGLHAEPQYKIVTPLTGKTFIAIVDIRINSATFGKVQTFTFDYTDINSPRRTLVISPGLANSILALGKEGVFYHYAVSDTYKSNITKRSIRWNDPDLKINWPIKNPVLSEADQNNPSLRELFPEKFT
ncbi:dTDP-4-dehydrorhamnose 3,5-epimerase family protein [Candidatus Microgenomates bacterium]|nr:dTDP-4-dehydrorhamnose 3,5-epimerase family protein [Candidatus Microgenomates bacterium]